MVKGEYSRASGYFDRAISPDKDFKTSYLAGIAYVADRQYTKAITVLERITRECPLTNSNILWAIKAHYYLGLAYEGVGRKSDAAAQYQYVVDLWKDADSQIDCLKDARKRLLELKSY